MTAPAIPPNAVVARDSAKPGRCPASGAAAALPTNQFPNFFATKPLKSHETTKQKSWKNLHPEENCAMFSTNRIARPPPHPRATQIFRGRAPQPLAALRFLLASVRRRSALSLMKPLASLWS